MSLFGPAGVGNEPGDSLTGSQISWMVFLPVIPVLIPYPAFLLVSPLRHEKICPVAIDVSEN